MINQSWLIVSNISKMPAGARWDLTRTTYCVGKKADTVSKKYQDELNEGLDMEGCIKKGIHFMSVCAIPWSQAREYSIDSIRQAIENAPEYK